MSEKTILITGSTSGIGLAGAEILGRQGWTVLLHSRNESRGLPVVEGLRHRVPQGRFELVTADLSDLGQVETLAIQVQRKAPTLDVLWNNAGVMVTEPKESANGLEYQWAVNHFAGFLLTSRLLPQILQSAQGRIIQTSSLAHLIGQVPGPQGAFRPSGRYNGWKTYADTKLANVLFTRELARRLAGTKVSVHAFHPGYVKTTIGSNGNPEKGNASSWLAFAQISPERGAETGVFLASDPFPGTISGRYWSSKKVRRGSGRATDGNAARLWTLTEQVLEDRK